MAAPTCIRPVSHCGRNMAHDITHEGPRPLGIPVLGSDYDLMCTRGLATARPGHTLRCGVRIEPTLQGRVRLDGRHRRQIITEQRPRFHIHTTQESIKKDNGMKTERRHPKNQLTEGPIDRPRAHLLNRDNALTATQCGIPLHCHGRIQERRIMEGAW